MPNDLSMIFNIITRDGSSPAFRTVAAEAKALSAAMAEADAKMTASTRATTASINASMAELGRAHSTTALQYDRATAQEIGANDSLELSQKKLAMSMQGLVAEQRAAAASAVETGATIDRVAADEAAATEASAAKRKASMMAFGAASAAALVGVAYYSIKAATSFEASMARVQTMAGASAGELKQMSKGILDLAPKVGVGPDKLAESLYHVESAGFHGAKALDMVAASAKLSALGQDDINSSTQAVVATLASNIKGVRDANDAAAQILHTVGTGDMTMHQFTQALGTGLLATAAAVGLSFRDVGAAIATMTDNAIPADQAATKLRTSLLMMVNPSKPAAAALASIGMNSTQLAGDLQKPDGLKVALDDIRKHLDSAFPKNGGIPLTIDAQRRAVAEYRQELATAGVQGKELDKAVRTYAGSLKNGTTNTVLQEQAFAKMFGGSKNAGTMLVLFNEQLDRMDPKLASYGDATSRAAELQAAWVKQQDTFKQKLNDLGASFDVMKIKIGNVLLPAMKDVIGFMGSHIGLVEALAFAIGTVLVAATVAWTVALQSNPVVLFVEGVALAGVAIYELVTHIKEVLHWLHELNAKVSIAIAVLMPFIGIPLLIFQHWQGIAGFFKGIWHAITDPIGSIKRAWDDLVGGFQNPKATFGPMVDGFDRFFIGIAERARRLPGDVQTAVGDASHWLWDKAKDAASGLWDGLIYGITHAFGIGERIGRAMGDAIGDLGKAISHVITTTDWGKVFGDVIKGIGDFLTGTDWGHVAGTIVDALIHAFEWAWKNKKNIMKIAGIIVGGIFLAVAAIPAAMILIGGSIVAGIVTGIYQASKPLRHAIGQFFTNIWQGITTGASEAVGAVSRFFQRIYHDATGAIGAAVDFISRHWRLIITIFMGPIGFVISLVARFGHSIAGFFERMWHDVSTFTVRMWRDVSGFFSRMWRDVSGFAARMWHDVAGFAARMWHDVAGFFVRMWSDVTGWVARMWHDVAGLFSRLWHDVAGFASRIWQDVSGWFSRLWHDVSGAAVDFWNFMKRGFEIEWHWLVDIATRLWHDVTKPFQSLWDGLRSGFNTVVADIDKAWHKLGNIFRLPINFLIHYVFNDAIKPVWNAVMDVVGEGGAKITKPMPEIPAFATGGVIPGNHDRDTVPFYGTPGEVVVPKPIVKAYGGAQSLMSMLGFDGQGGGAGSHLFGGGPIKRFGERLGHDVTHNPVTNAAGDVLHAITHNPVTDAAGDVLKAIAGLVRGALADTAGPVLNGALSLFAKMVPGADKGWGKASVDMGHGMVDKVMDWIRGQDTKDQAAMAAAMGGGDGMSWPLILQYAYAHGIPHGTVTTTGGKHVNGSYHYMGEAVDFGNAAFPNQRQVFDVFSAIAPNLLELFWDPAGHYWDSGHWNPGAIGGHGDHVHVAASLAGMQRALGIPVTVPGGAGSLGLRSYAESLLTKHGWGSQFGLLDYIINHESNWDVHAANSSGAYGIPQALPGNKMASAGADWHDNGQTQLRWMIDQYIPERYHTLQAAYDFKRRTGVYADGGMPPVGEPFWVGERGPELLRLGPGGRGSRVYSNEESRQMVGAGAPLMHVENQYLGSDIDLQRELSRADFLRQTANGFG